MKGHRLRVAVDIGGTFVDVVELDPRTNQLRFGKSATTPDDPADGVMAAVHDLGIALENAEALVHGTTLGLNALLERAGAVTGIITNAGFRDIFLVGRGNLPDAHMYDIQYTPPPPLVPRRRTTGVRGRIDFRGEEVEELDEAGVRDAARHLVEEQGVESIAICFLHSFRDPRHELRAAEIVRELYPGVAVSVSSAITREHREYERTSTTVLDAYIRRTFDRYIDGLHRSLMDEGFAGRFLVMRSGGGAMAAEAARRHPIYTIVSGPAGGIEGASRVARELARDVISFDMGGTSLDVCLIERGAAMLAHEAALEEHPLLIPIYDIRTIGAGGGSVAWIDEGLPRVGPRSAGARPGPMCYGRGGTEPTVTDAALCLGYLDPSRFLDGKMTLDAGAARDGVRRRIADPLGLDVEAAAAGILRVLLANTVGAVRAITLERGRDPAPFALLAFGGAGPMFAPLVAREMDIAEVIVAHAPAAFSSWGMLDADLVSDHARTSLRPFDATDPQELERVFAEMETEATASLMAQGVAASEVAIQRQLELRYVGQEHALTVDVTPGLHADKVREIFTGLHQARYGHVMALPLQVVNVRLRGLGRAPVRPVASLPAGDGDASRGRVGSRPAYCFERRAMTEFAVYDRALLAPGDSLEGPAVVDEGTSTTIVPTGQRLEVDGRGYLVIRRT